MSLNETQERQCREHDYDFSGLKALFLNCTLKPRARPRIPRR